MPALAPTSDRDPIGAQLVTAFAWLWVMVTVVTFWLRSQELHTASFFALAAMNPLLSLGLIPILVWALYRKLGVMLLGAGVLAFAQLIVNTPMDALTGCGDRSSPDEIRVVASNVYFRGATANEVADMLVQADADIVVLSEVVPLFLRELLAIEEVAARWPHKSARTDTDPSGLLVLSRFPISEQTIVGTYSIETIIDTPSGPLAFNGVHTTAPFNDDNIVVWYRQFAALNLYSRTKTLPMIMAGDFNATEEHSAFRTLLESTTDADAVGACGWSATWPTDLVGPAFMQLDHVLVNDSIEVLDLDSLELANSDHQSIRAVVRIKSDQ